MNQQIQPFVETSCFSPFECEMAEAPDDSEEKRQFIRKLSFRDSFELPQEATDDCGDFLSDILFARQRKMTNEKILSDPNSHNVCLTFDSAHPSQDHQAYLHSQQQPQQFIAHPSSRQAYGSENFPHLNNMTHPEDFMEEEEYENPPIVEQFESENFLTEIVNNNHGSSMKDNKDGSRPTLELQTIFGTLRQSNSPTSCMLKTKDDFEERLTFESPAPGKRFNNSSLETIKNIRDPDLRTITPQTLVNLMDDPLKRKFLVIDCRYPYEYKGGHISGAVNITSPEELEELLLKNRHLLCKEDTLAQVKNDWSGTVAKYNMRPVFNHQDPLTLTPPILIFHCEFSQKRGPRALRALRNLDRNLNSMKWPNLFYPEVYILENGYKNFHSKFPEHCDPKSQYIRMVDKIYKTHYVEAKMKDRMVWKKDENASKEEETLKPTVLQRFRTMVVM